MCRKFHSYHRQERTVVSARNGRGGEGRSSGQTRGQPVHTRGQRRQGVGRESPHEICRVESGGFNCALEVLPRDPGFVVPPGEHGQSAQAEAGGATQEGREGNPAPQLDGQENEEETQHTM